MPDRLVETTLAILLESFHSGFRSDSFIDQGNFRKFFERKTDCEFPQDVDLADVLDCAAAICCIELDGMRYVLQPETPWLLSSILLDLRRNGVKIVYFSELFKKDLDKFNQLGIRSPLFLAAALRKLYPRMAFEKEYLRFGGAELEDG